MERTSLKDHKLPIYSQIEERINWITHAAGGAFAIMALTILLFRSIQNGTVSAVVSSAVYGSTMLIMFVISSVYHALYPGTGKKVLQILDHCDIYFFIAGTYTPVTLVSFMPLSPVTAWLIFSIEWGLCALATIFTAIDLRKFRVLSMICYLGMGWGIVFVSGFAISVLGSGFHWLVAGGIAYSIGAILYGLGKKVPYMHAVFHLFVILGALLQFFAIVLYVV